MYDVKIEAGVVGSLLNNPKFYYHFEALKPEHFYDKINAAIYHIICLIIDEGSMDVSDYSIYLRASSDERYEKLFIKENVDIQDFLTKLKYVGTNDADEYRTRCKKIIDYAFKRDSIKKLNSTASYIEQHTLSANEANLYIQDELMKFADKYIVGANVQLIGDVLDDILQEISDRQQLQGGFAGLPSKFPAVNEYFTYEKGELVVIGATQKTGKSFWGLNEVWHKLSKGVPCAYFDTEMSTREFVIRSLSLLSGISVKNIKTGMLSQAEKDKLVDIYAYIKKQPFAHIYNPEWTFDEIYLTAKELQKTIGIEFLVFDYIKATNTTGLQVQEHNYLGDMTNFLKNNVAGKLDMPVLAFAQMSPTEQRLSDSAKIARYASVIGYFMKKTPEEIQNDGFDGGNRKFVVAFNRLGQQEEGDNYLNLLFDGNHAVINQAIKQPTDESINLFNKK